MGIRPEGECRRHELLSGRGELRHPHAPVSWVTEEPDQLHRDERAEVPRERRRIQREDFREGPHPSTVISAQGDGVEKGELGGMDAQRTKDIVVKARDGPGRPARPEAEAIGGHGSCRLAVGLHERCIYNDLRVGKAILTADRPRWWSGEGPCTFPAYRRTPVRRYRDAIIACHPKPTSAPQDPCGGRTHVRPGARMKVREAFELTLALCRRDADALDPDLLRPLRRAADRGAFHAYAMRQGVLGLALSTFRSRAAGGFDATTAQAITAPLRTLAQQARLWDMERDRVLSLLAREGLAPILLKGAALRLNTYRNPVERPVGDLDLLVPDTEMDRVVERLVGAGYRMPESQAVIDGFREHHFHLPMRHPNGFEAELHWALTPAVSTHRLDEREFIARAVTVAANGVTARVPCAEHMVLHLSSQNTEDHFSRLRRLVDLDRLVAAHPVNWDSVVSEARRGGLEAPVALSLQLAHHLLGTPVPSGLADRLGIGRAARVSLALLEPVSGIAHGSGPRRGVGKLLQEVWLASGAARTQHLRRLLAGEGEPLDWLWQGGAEPDGAPGRRRSRIGVALSLALYQCWIAACAPFALGTGSGRRNLGVWRASA